MPPGGLDHPHDAGIVFSLLHSALWIGGLVLLAWILWRWLGPRLRQQATPLFGRAPMPPQPEPSPLERLRVRFAAGEIDATTFEQMRERLQASYQPSGSPFSSMPPNGMPEQPGSSSPLI
jgi:HAMP domain-containing protein